ncbi:MAG TPA: patatin-like phospholipase family protein [Thermoleophilaceae bacterium]|jgi:NTE family protein
MSSHQVDLVLEGGGVKGIGLVGALAVLEENDWEPACVAGTSAGAITAALLAAGYKSAELQKMLLELDFHAFEDRGWEDRIPGGELISILKDKGVFEGKYLHEWVQKLLEAKNVRTFADLRSDEDEEQRRYRLRVIASDVTGRRLLALPQDAVHIGIEPDELGVADAVRMSMSIPLFFEPVSVNGHLIVDGGLLSNFPVWLFDSHGRPPRWPTFGLLLVEPEPRKSVAHRLEGGDGGTGLIDFLKAIGQTVLEAHDRLYVEQADFARTIPIPTLGVRTTEFDLSRERALELYESGRKAAEDFLARWDTEEYVERYRKGPVPSRRDTLTLRVPRE